MKSLWPMWSLSKNRDHYSVAQLKEQKLEYMLK